MALNLLSDWSDAIDNSRNELVFENKNKSYGAYQIRKGYGKTILISGVVGILSIFVILAVPAFLASANDGNKEKILSNEQITIDPIKDMKEELPPPPPPPPPIEEPPKIETTKFVETVIVDEEVKEEVKTQEELVDTKVSKKKKKGDDDGEIVIPEEKGKGDEVVESKPEEIFTVVEENAGFPGGEKELYKYLNGKLQNNYPSYEREAEIQGKVIVRFVVEKDGSITNADVVRKVSPGLDKLAKSTVESMPKWTPGKQGGKPVRMWFTLPVTFTLQ
jgi:protein TonB